MTRKARCYLWLPVVALVLAAGPAAATGITGAKVSGDTLAAKVRLPGGVGAELSVSFEQVVGLSAQNLGLSARLLDAADVALIANRLPSSLVSVPTGFPVLLTIEPPASGGLSFSGLVTVELYTHALTYLPGCPFRLYAAPLGGAFTDITESNAGGSYRVRGHKGDFSEFLIVADVRAVDAAIAVKFAQLDGELSAQAGVIESTVLSTLAALLDEAETAYAAGQTVQAIAKVEAFASVVQQNSGSGIPDVWRSARDLTNAAGRLRAAASTLRFSLLLKANGAS